MGELARRRRARDLWISHNHVRAGLVVFVFSLVIAFAAGATTQRGDTVVVETPGFLDGTPDGELVELLARVDAAAEPDGGLSRLTFPTALASDEAVPVAPPYGEMPRAATQVPTEAGVALGEGLIPEGWAVMSKSLPADEARLLADRLGSVGIEDVRIQERLVDGVSEVRVGVGGMSAQTDAQALLIRARQAPLVENAGLAVVDVEID